jgi:uncharacterized membrane protein YphA (DoxX/SURF4 family)
VALAAAFLAAIVAAVCFAGHLYQSERIAAARMRPTMAILSQPGPVTTVSTSAVARWRLPNGTERSGIVTAVTAPAINNAPIGASVQVWLGRSGEPEAPPPSSSVMILTALFAGFSATAGAAVALGVCYRLCRMALDRHRLAGWESAWAAIGPRWTSRH